MSKISCDIEINKHVSRILRGHNQSRKKKGEKAKTEAEVHVVAIANLITLTLTLTLWGDMAASEGVISGEGYKPPPRQLVAKITKQNTMCNDSLVK